MEMTEGKEKGALQVIVLVSTPLSLTSFPTAYFFPGKSISGWGWRRTERHHRHRLMSLPVLPLFFRFEIQCPCLGRERKRSNNLPPCLSVYLSILDTRSYAALRGVTCKTPAPLQFMRQSLSMLSFSCFRMQRIALPRI